MTLREEAVSNEPEIPSSHDLFQKMLEEELRKEEERMKNNQGFSERMPKNTSKHINFDDQPIKRFTPQTNPSSLPLQVRTIKQQNPSNEEERNDGMIESQTTKKDSLIMQHEIATSTSLNQQTNNTEAQELPNDTTFPKHIQSPLNSEQETNQGENPPKETTNDEFEVYVHIPQRKRAPAAASEPTTSSNNNPEEQPLFLSTPVMSEVLNSVTSPFEDATPSTPPSSNLLFENMLRKQLMQENNSSSNDENPAWKKKVDELEHLCAKFKESDPTDSVFQASGMYAFSLILCLLFRCYFRFNNTCNHHLNAIAKILLF